MEDFRLHSRHCPLGQPTGARRLDVDTDYGAFPVWTWFTLPPVRDRRPAREVNGCASPAYLGISAELATDLQTWADWQNRHLTGLRPPYQAPAHESDVRRWDADGRELARRLARETGDEVVYRWPLDGRDQECRHCGYRTADSRSEYSLWS